MKCLLYALFHTLNKMVSVLKCFRFSSCSLRLVGMLPSAVVGGSWRDILALIRGLNKAIAALTKRYSITGSRWALQTQHKGYS